MANQIPDEITRDNVSQVCDEINKKAKRLQRKLLTRRLVLILGCLCFVAISLLLCIGTIYHLCDVAEKTAIDSMPVLGAVAAATENAIFGQSLPVARLCVLLVGVQYLVPGALCVLLTLLVQLIYHPATAVEAVEEPARAHQLKKAIGQLYDTWLLISDGSKFRVFCNYLFTLGTAALFVLLMVSVGGVELDVSTILGGVVVFVLLHIIYKLLLGIYVGICKWLYSCKNPVNEQLRTAVSAYLRSVDPNAVPEEPKADVPSSDAGETVQPQEEIVHIDSFTWTVAYAQANEEKCGDTAMNYVEVAREFLRDGDYAGAAASLDRAAYALELLSRVPGGAKYMPYLYANQYAASRVYAFGLRDRDAAKFRLEQAVKNAGEFALKQLDGYESAIRDFKVMNGVLEEFNNGTSLSTLEEYYGSEFPYDIL